MFVRVLRMPLKPGAAESMHQAVRDYIAAGSLGGDFLGSLLLLSDDRRDSLGITFWRTREARDKSYERVPAVMDAYTDLLSDAYSLVGHYEIAVTNMIKGVELDSQAPDSGN